MGVEPFVIIMNGFEGKDISERTNPKIVEELTGVKVIKIPKIQEFCYLRNTGLYLLSLSGSKR